MGNGSSDLDRMRRAVECPTLPAFQAMRTLSQVAKDVLDYMAEGNVLCVPHDRSQHATLERYPGKGVIVSCPVSGSTLQELLTSNLIHKLTRDGEPPEGQRRYNANPGPGYPLYLESYRRGWRELNLDGERADWYVCTQ